MEVKPVKFKFTILKSLFALLLFLLAINYEGASIERLTLLILFFTLFLGWGYLRPFLGNYPWMFIIDGFIIFF